MNEILKKFFTRHLGKEKDVTPTSVDNFDKGEMTYEDWGFEKARNLQGNLMAFKGCLNLVERQFLQEQGLDENKIQKNIINAKIEAEKVETDIEKEEGLIKKIEQKIEGFKEKIIALKKEIFKIEENPKSLSIDKASKAGFVIGLFILIFLTLYLFVFYSSASYSAFYKKFEEEMIMKSENYDSLTSTVLDPLAISRSFESGIPAFIFILTIPFIFLGLGYLIHKFQEGKGVGKYYKIGMLVLVTFAFDCLLAYEIENNLYKAQVANSTEENLPLDIPIFDAIASPNFWLIIFSGFIVYLIWGFIFDFVMDSYDKLDAVKLAINTRKKEIEEQEKEVQKADAEILTHKDTITELKKKLVGYKAIISGEITIIDWEGFEKKVLNFTTGWTHWMTANKYPKVEIDNTWEAEVQYVNNHRNKPSQD